MATKTAAKLQISMSFRDAGYERGLKKARQDTRRTQSAIQRMSPSLRGLGAAATAAGAALGAAFAARGLFRAGRAAVDLFAEQEKALVSLEAALEATGKGGAASLKLITDEATRVQRATTAGDEALINATATLAQLAPALNAEELARAQSAIVGIADTFLKGNIENAALLIGKSIGSATNALTRYGVQIDTAASQSDKLNQLLESTGTFFDVSQAKATTYAGQIEQLKNFFGDMGEVIGESLMPPLREFQTFLVDSRDDIEEFAREFARQIGNVSETMQTLLQASSVDLAITAGAVGQLIGAKLGEGIFRGLQGVVRTFTGPLKRFLESAGIPGTAEFLLETVNPGLAALELAADAAASSVDDARQALDALAGSSASGLRQLDRVRSQTTAAAALLRGDFAGGASLFAGGPATDRPAPAVFTDKQLAEMQRQADVAARIRRNVEDAERDFFERRFRVPDFSDIGGRAFDGQTIAADLDIGPIETPEPAFEVDQRIAGLTPDQRRRFIDGVPLDELTGEIKGFGMQTKELLFGVGEDMITGLIQGTLDMGDILKRFLLGFAARFILGPLSTALGIASPSKIARGFGVDLGRGLLVGMDSMKAAVSAASERMAMAAMPVMPATPRLAFAGDGPSAVMQLRAETPPVNLTVEALFDPYREAQSAGGQVFHREAARTARQMGVR